jgi:ElaB/YqjD/DUF883 family membrane-anchored ribosome-binding protein
MHRKNNESKDNLTQIVDETKALLAVTAHATEDTVVAARNRLTSALEATQEACNHMKEKAIASAKAADKVIRAKPYQSIGIAFGLGAIIGYLWSRRSRE